MGYEQVQKPSSSYVPVQKKVSGFAPPASRVQAKDVTAGEQEQMPLGSTPATDANWLMKHPLFKGNQFLQRVVAPASESESLESEESLAQRETVQRQEEGNESGTPYSLPVQAKLTIGEPGDKYEQEADRVAADVVQRIHAPAAKTGGEGALQRQEMGEEEEVRMKSEGGTLQRVEISQLNRKSSSGNPSEASADLEASIQGARGSGQPLANSVREPMERAFGADFSGVRVHTDGTSDQLNQSIQAKAFTTGQDVFFRQGEYNPGSRGGQELIAHELTHVVQQNSGAVQRSPLPPQPLPQHPTTEIPSVTAGEGALHGKGEKTGNRQESSVKEQASSYTYIKESSPTTVQRHIHWVAPPGQFQVDAQRPGWMDGMMGVPVLANQSRNHIIDFENIQNDLAIILNDLVAANTPVNQNRLIALTDALMPTAGVAQANMVAMRNTLMASIGAGTVANYHGEARALLSRLNSSPDNVRVGDSGINAAIGQNIDADFNAGTTPFPGGMVITAAAPAGVMVPAQPVLTLTVASNDQVYRYQMATTQMITFVINPFNNRQLSSVTGPTVGTVAPAPPYPVLVTDPTGVNLPFLYT